MSILTGGYPAEYGRKRGGIIEVVIRVVLPSTSEIGTDAGRVSKISPRRGQNPEDLGGWQ